MNWRTYVFPVRDDDVCHVLQAQSNIKIATSIAQLWLLQEIVDGLDAIRYHIERMRWKDK